MNDYQRRWAFGPWPDEELKLDGGAWRLNPWTRIREWVPEPKPAPKPPRGTSPHGTVTTYNRHIWNKETPCDPCREANRVAKREARHRRAAERKDAA